MRRSIDKEGISMQSHPDDYAFVSPRNEHDWCAYHEIRRTVLFEGRGMPYDVHHPDEHAPRNHPKLLTYRGEPVAVVRIDVAGAVAFFRRVAVRVDAARRGHGRVLLATAEQFAREQGCGEVQSFVAPDAVGFYRKCGFTVLQEGVTGPSGRTAVLMMKRL